MVIILYFTKGMFRLTDSKCLLTLTRFNIIFVMNLKLKNVYAQNDAHSLQSHQQPLKLSSIYTTFGSFSPLRVCIPIIIIIKFTFFAYIIINYNICERFKRAHDRTHFISPRYFLFIMLIFEKYFFQICIILIPINKLYAFRFLTFFLLQLLSRHMYNV